MVGERVNREITNFHLLRWHATKVVKVVVCTKTCILLSLISQSYNVKKIDFKSIFRIQYQFISPAQPIVDNLSQMKTNNFCKT